MGAQDEYIEWMICRVDEDAANTFTEESFDTPVTENYAMLIHEIIAVCSTLDNGLNDGDAITICLTTQSKDSLPANDDEDIIHKAGKLVTVNAGGDYTYIESVVHPFRMVFSKPILIVKRKLYVSLKGTGQGAAGNVIYKIGYTLRKLTPKDMLDALVE